MIVTTEKARMMIINDDYPFSTRVKQTLGNQEDMEIVDESISLTEALPKIELLCPNIIIIGASHPGVNEIDTCRRIANKGYEGDIYIFGGHQRYIDVALKAGASGYYPKEVSDFEMEEIIRMSMRWQAFKGNSENTTYSISQIQNMILEHISGCNSESVAGVNKGSTALPLAENDRENIEEVKILISLPHSVSQMHRLTNRMKESLRAGIKEANGSINGTSVTLGLPAPTSPSYVFEMISGIPGVQEASLNKSVEVKWVQLGEEEKSIRWSEVSVTLREVPPIPVETAQIEQHIEVPDFSRQMAGAAVS